MRYIKHTQQYRIAYRKRLGVLKLEGYSDSDWGAYQTDRRSVGAYVFNLAGGPVAWACKKNESICLSSTESEYKALTSAAKEAIWERRCLADVGHGQ